MLFHLFHEYDLEKDQSAAHPPCQDTTWATHSLETLGAMSFLMVRLLCFIFTCIWAMPPCNYTIHIYYIYMCILYIYDMYIYIYYIHIDTYSLMFGCLKFLLVNVGIDIAYMENLGYLVTFVFYHPWMSQCRTSWLMFHPFDHVPSFSMTGWWFHTFVISIFYMGCHPSHWRTPSWFKMVIAPPTRWCCISFFCLGALFRGCKTTRVSTPGHLDALGSTSAVTFRHQEVRCARLEVQN